MRMHKLAARKHVPGSPSSRSVMLSCSVVNAHLVQTSGSNLLTAAINYIAGISRIFHLKGRCRQHLEKLLAFYRSAFQDVECFGSGLAGTPEAAVPPS